MKNNKGFASSFMIFSLLIFFLIIISIVLFTLNSSSTLNSKIKSKLTNDIENPDLYSKYDFYYTGDIQVFSAPKSSLYKIKTWSSTNNYSSGNILLKKGQKLFIFVGKSGYNNGDTDIREKYGQINDSESLSSIILKAGNNASNSMASQKLNNTSIKNSNNLGDDINPTNGVGHVTIYFYSINASNVAIDSSGSFVDSEYRDKFVAENCSDLQCILDKISAKLNAE